MHFEAILPDQKGLSKEDIPQLQLLHGKNKIQLATERRLIAFLREIILEPMFLLLVIACVLYFSLGEIEEGIMMAVCMVLISAISIFQNTRSSHALDALKQLTEPRVKVIRDGTTELIDGLELVPADLILLEEGDCVPADAVLVQSNDLSINESAITGESLPVFKHATSENRTIYLGSTIESGKGIARITATGNHTLLGKMGKAVAVYSYQKTTLQRQLSKMVRNLAIFGFVAFFIILAVNLAHYHEFITSLLFALTMAMSVVPEEIPVAFSAFMALGAMKMSRHGIISRHPQTIENLGTTTVLCLDKTGTITENKMRLKVIYDSMSNQHIDVEQDSPAPDNDVLKFATLASETNPFDSMEQAIWDAGKANGLEELLSRYRMIHEYPLSGYPPMMTHVYESPDQQIVVAGKGAAERIAAACKLKADEISVLMETVRMFGSKGYRVLGVAGAMQNDRLFPNEQDDFSWEFKGLIGLYDPPRENARDVVSTIIRAGINVKLVTGDFPDTALNIAAVAGINTKAGWIAGEQVMTVNEDTMASLAREYNVFARMFPEAKLKLIESLKLNGEIVAMTGDGINDAAALKAADIGIAMGKRGTETAKRSSDIILTDDNLEKLVIAIREGRKIFSNLLKGIRYIISIHIPIILTAAIPALLGWKYPNIFSPVHVIFLELVMGPTCSVFFENEPVERDLMLLPPRQRSSRLFAKGELSISVIQGVVITTGVLLLFAWYIRAGGSIEKTTTAVFVTLILSNTFLTFSTRSFTKTINHTITYKNNLVLPVLLFPLLFLLLVQFVPEAQELFRVTALSWEEYLYCLVAGVASVGWFEAYKSGFWKRRK